ncbi:MAG: DUF2188 domain-containing protein [Propionibacteriales bacterium]|nr:DUF2188 domain-containing protein [Propionibacteriales bacterium]
MPQADVATVLGVSRQRVTQLVGEAKSHQVPTSSTKSHQGPREVGARRERLRAIKRRDVVPSNGGGWDVVKPGSHRPSAHTDTQTAAIARARDIVKNAGGGEVRIHGRDGKVRGSDTVSLGEGPNPARAKRARKAR